MESPSLIEIKVACATKKSLLDVMDIMVGFGKSFSYQPEARGIRILIRSRARMNALLNEIKAVTDAKVRRYYR